MTLERRSLSIRAEDSGLEPILRRDVFRRASTGFAAIALASMLERTARAGIGEESQKHRMPHVRPRAKRVIFLFMHGGPSQLDTFDEKPALVQHHGKPLPFAKPKVVFAQTGNVFRSPWEFQRHGASGTPVSALFPETARVIDQICLIKSIHGSNPAHGGACMMLQTGSANLVRPSMGSWISYGLGSENDRLPTFVTIDPSAHGGHRNWSSAFLPAEHQGTAIRGGRIADLGSYGPDPGAGPSDLEQRRREILRRRNAADLLASGNEREFAARIASWELAFRFQVEAPEAFDLSKESAATQVLYGADAEPTAAFARRCILARRLAERGVRFIQVSHAYWDQHGDLEKEHARLAREVDRPIAGLISDLAQRGLLDDTLVIWGGEFGRTPCVQGNIADPSSAGRDHNPHGYTMWLAGGGVKGGISHGATDDFGWYAVENPVHIHDFHATLLALLGIDHEALTYPHAGREFRLTDVSGRVVDEIFA
jgi:hypothetical protein